MDAQRLAYYAFLHRHALKTSQLPSDQLLELKQLFAFRDRLVKTQTSLKQTLKELKQSAHLINNDFILMQSEKQLKFIAEQIKQVEAQIMATTRQDELVQKNMHLLCSIPGIGGRRAGWSLPWRWYFALITLLVLKMAASRRGPFRFVLYENFKR
ncbi:MAG: transposase [Bacteroidota bacterium]